MLTFFSTFIMGTKEIVQKELFNLFPDVEIAQSVDGLIVYRTNQPKEQIKALRFFNNSYLLIKQFNKVSTLKDLIKGVLDSDFEIPKDNYAKEQTFRFVISQENQTQKINRDLLTGLENKVIAQTNLTVDRAKPDIEFIILLFKQNTTTVKSGQEDTPAVRPWVDSLRSEGYGFLGLRLTYPTLDQKILQKGQLRPELAHLLSLLADPKPTDILLDSFSGYGSIPKELENLPHHQIIASDLNLQNITYLNSVIASEAKQSYQKIATSPSAPRDDGSGILTQQADATNLKEITDQSIDKIVTDPPWGIFDPAIILEDLYPKMLQEFHRILKPDGIVVLLIGQKEIFENIFDAFKYQFKLEEKYNILVSGKKASIYRLSRI